MSAGPAPSREPEAGLTLVEMLVALVVFALVGTAGLSMLDGLLRAQARTEGRLETLARVQRVLHVAAGDLMQTAGRSVYASGTTLALRRPAGVAVTYALEGGALVRHVRPAGTGSPARQVLLPDATDLSWRFFHSELGWIPDWPPEAHGTEPEEPVSWPNPAAIELQVTLGGSGLEGALRRVAILPAEVGR